MITLKDSIKINRPPKEIAKWLDKFVEMYREWHPDHGKAKWLKGKNFEEGSVLYAEEYLGGKLEKLTFKVTKHIPNKIVKYKVGFPESLVCTGGSFYLKPVKQGTIFTATLSFRFGWLLSRLFKKKLAAIKQHMKEEGISLKKMIEKK